MTLVTGETTTAAHPTDPVIPAATRASLNAPATPEADATPAKPAATTTPRQRLDQFSGTDKKPTPADRELTPPASGTGGSGNAYHSEPAPRHTLPSADAKKQPTATAHPQANKLAQPKTASTPFVADVTPKPNASSAPTKQLGAGQPAATLDPRVGPRGASTTIDGQTSALTPATDGSFPAFTLDQPTPAFDLSARPLMPTEQLPLAEMAPDDAARYFAHLDTAFADIDAHRGVMHGPMQWPQPDTPAGQERVELLVAKLFKPKERPESAYTTLILYMPLPSDPKRLDKIAGFATAVSRQLRTMVEQGVMPLATATVLHQSLARHAAAGSHPKDAQTITRMFERKRLEVVSIGATKR